MSNGHFLEIADVTKGYESSREKHTTPVLQHLFLNMEQGERIGIIGPSGSGKSTLLRLICGLERPDSGSIMMDGVILNNGKKNSPSHTRDISFVFQSPALWPHMTIEQNIMYPAKDKNIKMDHLLEQFDIAHLAKRVPSQISGGQAKRAAIARALAADRKLLLMDEPLTNLDKELKNNILGTLSNYFQQMNTTLIYVTHDSDELEVMTTINYRISGGVLHHV